MNALLMFASLACPLLADAQPQGGSYADLRGSRPAVRVEKRTELASIDAG